jgi:hypothetical protein
MRRGAMGGSQSSEKGDMSSDIITSNAVAKATIVGSVNSGSKSSGDERNREVHRDMNASKMRGDCRKLAAESYKCLEKGDHEACKPFFEAYKECRKDEHAKKLAANGQRYRGE